MHTAPTPAHIAALALAALVLTGCTTLHGVPTDSPERTTAAVAPGARLVVTLRDGRVIEDRFIQATEDALVVGHIERVERGLDRDNRAADKHQTRIALDWEGIAQVEQRQVSGWRTVALVVIPIAALNSMASQIAVMP
jgi:hypothetical protein